MNFVLLTSNIIITFASLHPVRINPNYFSPDWSYISTWGINLPHQFQENFPDLPRYERVINWVEYVSGFETYFIYARKFWLLASVTYVIFIRVIIISRVPHNIHMTYFKTRYLLFPDTGNAWDLKFWLFKLCNSRLFTLSWLLHNTWITMTFGVGS